MTGKRSSLQIELGEIRNTCFVVMPFDPLFQLQYERVIRPAAEEAGLSCDRGDEIYSRPDVMKDIWSAIRRARVVVAELTGRNANVLYEVGLAHAIGKPIILLTRNEEDIPFDLRALRYRFYDINDPFWGLHLSRILTEDIKEILNNPDLARHLDGIELSVTYPAMPDAPIVSLPGLQLRDVSGIWKGSWKRFGASIDHSGHLQLNQDQDRLQGGMAVTFQKSGDITVIQEELIGSLNDEKVSLKGVSYTYVRRGRSQSYLMDNFMMSLNADGRVMSGSFESKRGKGEARFERAEESGTDST